MTPLSRRECETLQLLAGGLIRKEVAARLGVSESTVKTWISRACEKLDARSRTHAVVLHQAAHRMCRKAAKLSPVFRPNG